MKSIMQAIYNECPQLDHKDSKKISDKFTLIGPVDIDEELEKSDDKVSFDENLYKIGYI
jgi:hypothetical protein